MRRQASNAPHQCRPQAAFRAVFQYQIRAVQFGDAIHDRQAQAAAFGGGVAAAVKAIG
jgi:hypothetical protein